jgi:hypothetical protein
MAAMTDKTDAMGAYDKASLAITNMQCAAHLLLSSDPRDHTSEMGQDNRDFLQASILDNGTPAEQALEVLSPHKAPDAA